MKKKTKDKYTVSELKNLYWQFKKEIMTTYISYGNGCGSSTYGIGTKIVYQDKLIDFFIWLETQNQ